LAVLAALEADSTTWLHGYLVAKQTGLASGTLYPILIRLAERRLIEARWEDEQPAGRPRRHLYRLTSDGSGRHPHGAGPGGTQAATRGRPGGPAAAGGGGRRVMDRLTRMLTGLVRGLAGLLGEHRRDWVHALLAETDDLPAPSARLAWLGGGLWLVAREVLMNRIIQALAFAAGAVALVWIGWPGASSNSATPVNRMYVVGTLILLAGLPLVVRRYVGPVRPGWAPRLVRPGGYAVVLALIAATAVQQRIGSQLGGYLPVILPIWAMDVGFLLIIAGYVAGLLILTSHRVQFTRRVLPTSLGIGALTAGTLYPVAPFGINDTAETAAHSLHGGPVVVPLAGAALGALRGHLRYPPAATRPEGPPRGA
jgi:PadR family transcriptional regulator, regulatory protein PadR